MAQLLEVATATAVQEKLWRGAVPAVFTLHPADVTTLHAPRPFYAMLARGSYLVAQTREVIEYLREAAPPTPLTPTTIWFEADGRPLRWHLPVGLLFDLAHADPHAPPALPWAITVHFSGFPVDELLPCENERAVESFFMHSLKQALFLRTGSTKLIMGMPEAQQTQIWTSVVHADLPGYLRATRDLELSAVGLATASPPAGLRLVPLRLYLPTETAMIQQPVPPLDATGTTERTLGGVLALLLPDLFGTAPDDRSRPRVLLHGLALPMDVPVVALYQALAYPDGFLHLAILP